MEIIVNDNSIISNLKYFKQAVKVRFNLQNNGRRTLNALANWSQSNSLLISSRGDDYM